MKHLLFTSYNSISLKLSTQFVSDLDLRDDLATVRRRIRPKAGIMAQSDAAIGEYHAYVGVV
jgi:hypothetical protein